AHFPLAARGENGGFWVRTIYQWRWRQETSKPPDCLQKSRSATCGHQQRKRGPPVPRIDLEIAAFGDKDERHIALPPLGIDAIDPTYYTDAFGDGRRRRQTNRRRCGWPHKTCGAVPRFHSRHGHGARDGVEPLFQRVAPGGASPRRAAGAMS